MVATLHGMSIPNLNSRVQYIAASYLGKIYDSTTRRIFRIYYQNGCSIRQMLPVFPTIYGQHNRLTEQFICCLVEKFRKMGISRHLWVSVCLIIETYRFCRPPFQVVLKNSVSLRWQLDEFCFMIFIWRLIKFKSFASNFREQTPNAVSDFDP